MSYSGHPGTLGEPGRDHINDLIELPPEQRVVAVINHAFGGVHHTNRFTRNDESTKPYWTCTVAGSLCTWDFASLSKLVVASLEYGVRVEVSGGGPYRMKLQLFPRYTRDGMMFERIPRLDHFVQAFNYEQRLKDSQ